MTTILEKNLHAISANHNYLFKKILNNFKSTNFKKIKISEHLINVFNENTNSFIHNNLPAELYQLNNSDFSKSHLIIIFGIGTGFYLKILLNKYPYKHFVVIDYDLNYFNYFISEFDYADFFNKKNICFIINQNVEEINKIIERHFGILLYTNLTLIENNEQTKFHNEYYDKIRNNFNIITQTSLKNYNTLSLFKEVWEKNIFKNLQLYLKTNDISKLQNLFLNLPALIIGAGPSLDKNISLLKENQNKFIIIAMDSSVRALINNNIIPDFILAIDAQNIILKFLCGLNYNSSFLVAMPLIMNEVFNLFNENIFVFNYGHPLLNYIDEITNKTGKIAVSGSVSICSLDFAVQLGCSPLIFIGCDFGSKNIFSYNKTTANEKLEFILNSLNKFNTIENFLFNNSYLQKQIIQNNKIIYTSDDLICWYNIFDEQIKINNLNCINCSDEGLLLKNAPFEKFEKIIKKFNSLNFDKFQKIKKICDDKNFHYNYNEIVNLIKINLNSEKKKIETFYKRINNIKEHKEIYLEKIYEIINNSIMNKNDINHWNYKFLLFKNDYQINEDLIEKIIKELEEKII
ncbi:MAG TPA: DUF115 domain-containing protein [bacterium]|nr:DUF115 domain-containing protein [bacterium]HOL47043.1 DUF115 domain-containing protein [bacterium]HPQ17952.1 DUF115 domain-containing protein [bacterium]